MEIEVDLVTPENGWAIEYPMPINIAAPGLKRGQILPVTLTSQNAFSFDGAIDQKRAGAEGIETGDVIDFEITNLSSDWISGKYHQMPVCVPGGNTEDVIKIGDILRVAVTNIHDCYIEADIRALPEQFKPSEGQTINISAETTKTTSRGVLAWWNDLPVLCPLTYTPPRDDLQFTVVSVQPQYIIAIPPESEPEEGWKQNSEYWAHMKMGCAHFNSKSFKQAQELFEAASVAAENDPYSFHQMHAKRFAIYSEAESYIERDELKAALDTVESFTSEHGSTKEPIATAIRSELRAYNLAIKTIRTVDKGSIPSLHRIAGSPEIRSLLREISEEIQNAEKNTIGFFGNSIPHDIVLYRIAQCVEQASDYHPPKEILSWITEAPSNHQNIAWSLSASSSENSAIEPSLPTVATSDSENQEGLPEGSELVKYVLNNKQSDPSVRNVSKETTEATSRLDADVGSTSEDSAEHSSEEESRVSPPSTGTTTVKTEVDTKSEADNSIVDSISASISSANDSSELHHLRKRAEAVATDNPIRDTSAATRSRYQRAQPIRRYAKKRANGRCECCGDPAPFVDSDNEPYLEVHHVDELGTGGADSPDKVIALCPTCHKRIHHGADGTTINKKLRAKLESGLAELGTK